MRNRVTPTGDIIDTKARGAWLGNRGQLHGNGKTILRPFKHQAWIICLLSFKNRHRQVMSPGLWTELFFYDEATAFSAGHRPCFECRRDDAVRFKKAWLDGNPEYGFNMKTPIKLIDEILQRERIDKANKKLTYIADTNKLSNGTFIKLNDQPYLMLNNKIHLWTPFGYSVHKTDLPAQAEVLTPLSVVNAFKAGYDPLVNL